MDFGSDEETTTTVYVGNLPFETEQDEVELLCQPYGQVKNVFMFKPDQVFSGVAFVKMSNREEGQKLIDGLDETQFARRTLKVKFASHKFPQKRKSRNFDKGGPTESSGKPKYTNPVDMVLRERGRQSFDREKERFEKPPPERPRIIRNEKTRHYSSDSSDFDAPHDRRRDPERFAPRSARREYDQRRDYEPYDSADRRGGYNGREREPKDFYGQNGGYGFQARSDQYQVPPNGVMGNYTPRAVGLMHEFLKEMMSYQGAPGPYNPEPMPQKKQPSRDHGGYDHRYPYNDDRNFQSDRTRDYRSRRGPSNRK